MAGDDDDADLRKLMRDVFTFGELGRWDPDDFLSSSSSTLSSLTSLSASNAEATPTFSPTPMPMPTRPLLSPALAFSGQTEKGKKLCFVCRLQLTSCDDEHVRGKKHMRKAALLGLPPHSLGSPEQLSAPATPPATPPASAAPRPASQAYQAYSLGGSTTPLTSPPPQPPPPAAAKASAAPVVVPCFICRLGLSVNDVMPHVRGKAHHHK